MKSFTITEFCKRHGYSRSYYYKLASMGRAPRSFNPAGGARRITEAAEAEWIAALEAESAQGATVAA
jgi:predicted DNA-binding transcriptional regulator AlpA